MSAPVARLAEAIAARDQHRLVALTVGWVPSLFLLPNPMFNDPYFVDNPAWSLMFEVVGNLFFAIGAVWLLRWRNLALSVFASVTGLVAVALLHGTIEVGSKWPTLGYGLPRMAASFMIGITLYRWWETGSAPRLRLPFGLLAAILIALLLVPPELHRLPVPFYELACVLLAFPAIILSGAQREPGILSAPIARLSAELSYPVYILHMPLIYTLDYMSNIPTYHPKQALVLLVIVSALAAFASSRFYDIPVRTWLANRRRHALVRATS